MCVEHHTAKIHSNIQELIHNPDKELHIGDHKFNCPVTYLKHEIEHPAHEHIDTIKLSKNVPHIEKQLEQQINHQLQHEMMK